MTILFFLLGLAALILGAELLVRGASRLALSFGISPLVVGLTVVAFGTSSPEMAVSVQSAWSGQVDLALGNVVGSNIFNVLFILGASALIVPLVVHQQLIRQEVPVMIGASLLLWALAADGGISRWEGGLLAGLLAGYTVLIIRQSRRENAATQAEVQAEYQEAFDGPPKGWDAHWGVQALLILAGLALLVLGAHWLVEAAVAFARHLGVSELVIGLTIVAAGTSLPEVATSLLAAARGERDIAVGNVVGSNLFNILGVLGLSASVAPASLAVAPAMLAFDLPVMVAVAVACLPIFFTGNLIARWEGGLFLAFYAAYVAYLILHASQHAALQPFSAVMGGYVLPLTAVTLAVLAARHWRAARGAQ
ncbi:MAG: calcium/sodium antiporter [Thiobacillaceae bacterium]|jgi:cation:H+ antiporter|nr:calcium/sodium antiporter [Thiobacillaceae bacterium]